MEENRSWPQTPASDTEVLISDMSRYRLLSLEHSWVGLTLLHMLSHINAELEISQGHGGQEEE
jgi:hypothetical protein